MSDTVDPREHATDPRELAADDPASASHLPSAVEVVSFRDAEVVSEHGDHIGKVVDVLYDDDATTEPQWLAVHVGPLAAEHYVPLVNAYRSVEGRVVVAYDKATVKHAPKAHRDHVITNELRDDLRRYYGLN